MAVIAPILAGMGFDALLVSGLVLSARVAIFAHQFLRKRSL